MPRVYAGASSILVIDPELRDPKAADLEPNEVDLALHCSPWMARSRAMQEGAVAVDIKLELADTVFAYDKLDPRDSFCRRTQFKVYGRERRLDLNPNWDFLLDMRSMSQHQNFIRIWNELRNRTSTKTEDMRRSFALELRRTTFDGRIYDKNDNISAWPPGLKRAAVSPTNGTLRSC